MGKKSLKMFSVSRYILFGMIFLLGWLPYPDICDASGSSGKTGFIVPLPEGKSEGFQPRLGSYYYTIEWGDIRAATATVSVKRDGDYYRIVGDTKTTKIIDQIFRIRYRGEGIIRSKDYSPVETVLDSRKRSSRKRTEIRFLENGDIEVAITKTKGKKDPTTQIRKVQPDSFVLEPFSAIFLARGFNWSKGETQRFEIITGKKKYLITLACLGKGVVSQGDKKIEAWIIQPIITRLDKPDKSSKNKGIRLYLSTDHSRDLLKIKTKTVVGTVALKLIRFEPQGSCKN